MNRNDQFVAHVNLTNTVVFIYCVEVAGVAKHVR
jgi:hypothetical protein